MPSRRGFTLIELLVVVLIVSLLAAIAIPKLAGTRDRAKLASIRSDVRNIMTAQESYFSDYAAYAPDWSTLATGTHVGVSPGNTATVSAAGSGWSATVDNPTISVGFTQCTVQVSGGAASTVDGVIICS
jgi:prepilin-type N-terminal cleavage/methylation domain-containing protein